MRISEVVGQNMRDARETAGLTQVDLGRQLGALLGKPWTNPTVSGAEHGGRDFVAEELVALAAVLRVPVARLLIPPPGVGEIDFPAGEVGRKLLPPPLGWESGDREGSLGKAGLRAVGLEFQAQALIRQAEKLLVEAGGLREELVAALGQDRVEEIEG